MTPRRLRSSSALAAPRGEQPPKTRPSLEGKAAVASSATASAKPTIPSELPSTNAAREIDTNLQAVQACAIATASRHDRDATPRKKRAVGVAEGACECSSEGWTRRGIAGAPSPGVLIVCAMRASVLSSPIRWPATAGSTCTRCSYSPTGVVPRSWQPESSAPSRTSTRRARESHAGCSARLNGSVGGGAPGFDRRS